MERRMTAYQQLPKVELHLHLDCSLSYEVVNQIKPKITKEEYQASFIAPAKCKDLADYLKRAESGIQLMQMEEQLILVIHDLFNQLKKDNVIYAEIRFAPLLHTVLGLSAKRVVEVVNKTVDKCISEYGIEAGIILCTLRHYNQAQSLATAQLVQDFKGSKVVGFDIAGNEAGSPIDQHVQAFQFAYAQEIYCTAHAGEAKGSDSIWETLEHFKPTRIGHGVRSVEDEGLISHLIGHQIHLEICPTSNIQVDVFNQTKDHTINKLYNAGVSLGINTDARAISNVSLTQEYKLLAETFNWSIPHFKKCNLQAIEHAFADKSLKARLKDQIQLSY